MQKLVSGSVNGGAHSRLEKKVASLDGVCPLATDIRLGNSDVCVAVAPRLEGMNVRYDLFAAYLGTKGAPKSIPTAV